MSLCHDMSNVGLSILCDFHINKIINRCGNWCVYKQFFGSDENVFIECISILKDVNKFMAFELLGVVTFGYVGGCLNEKNNNTLMSIRLLSMNFSRSMTMLYRWWIDVKDTIYLRVFNQTNFKIVSGW
jgi:hypothetical protein